MGPSKGVLLIAFVAAAIAIAGCSSSEATLETVSPEAAAEIIANTPDVVILDIRTPEEFAEGFVEGASNIDFYRSDFAGQLDVLDKDAPYVVYCRSDNRSGEAMEIFADLGFTNVTEIDGGIVNWYESGLPIVFG